MLTPNDEAETLCRMRMQTFGESMLGLGVLIAIMANATVLYWSCMFYRSASATPAGTSIRPMGLVFTYFIVALGSLITAFPLCIAAASFFRKAGHKNLVSKAIKAAIISLAPLPLGVVLFHATALAFGLNLAD